MISRSTTVFVSGFLLAAIAGCASYPEQVQDLKDDLLKLPESNPPVYDIYSDTGGNKLLALQERGRLEQLCGRYRESSAAYAEAIKFSDALEDKALVSVGDALDSSMAVTYGNDLALDYPASGFERMMLHVLDGFDRLALGDIDGFGVDMRNLERCRGMIKTRLKRDMEVLEQKVIRHGESATATRKSYDSFMREMEKLAPGLKHSTDNVYALFLMGLYREMRGDLREALGHYSEIQKIWPNNPAVAQSIARCSGARMDAGCGDVIIFFEEGFIPSKRTKHAVFGSGELFATLYMTLPNYSSADCLPYEDGGTLVLFENDGYVAHARTLCDLAPLAVKAHEERLKGIIARKALTSGMTTGMIHINHIFNGTVTSNPFGEALLLCGGFFTAITADIMVAASERPDLRSWCLLPRQVQAARFSAKAGRHVFTLRSANKSEKVTVDVPAGGRTVVYCTTSSGKMRCFAAPLGGAAIQ